MVISVWTTTHACRPTLPATDSRHTAAVLTSRTSSSSSINKSTCLWTKHHQQHNGELLLGGRWVQSGVTRSRDRSWWFVGGPLETTTIIDDNHRRHKTDETGGTDTNSTNSTNRYSDNCGRLYVTASVPYYPWLLLAAAIGV